MIIFMCCLHVEEEEERYIIEKIYDICACRLLRYVKIEIFKMSLSGRDDR